MEVFVNLPRSVDANEPELETWNGVIADIPNLLRTREIQVRANWYSTAPKLIGNSLGRHPHVNKIQKELKSYGEVLINRELANQAEFLAAVKGKRDEQITRAKGDPQIIEWHRPNLVAKTETRWAPLESLLSGV